MATKKTTTKRTTKKATPKKATGGGKAAAKKTPAKKAGGKMSQMDAAIKVLQAAKEPMTCKAMVEAMAKKKLWHSPGGKTPEATLYASILRDLKKGKDARFKKVDRGQFALAKRK